MEDKTISRRRKIQLVIAAVVVIAILNLGWYLLNPIKNVQNFTLQDLNGNLFSLRDFKGNVVLLDFMATWCGPCQASMPDLLAIHKEIGEEVVFVSITIDPLHDTDEVLESWKIFWEADWIHARDLSDPPVGQMFEVVSTPTYIILNKRGLVKFKHVGLTPDIVIRQELLELIKGGW